MPSIPSLQSMPSTWSRSSGYVLCRYRETLGHGGRAWPRPRRQTLEANLPGTNNAVGKHGCPPWALAVADELGERAITTSPHGRQEALTSRSRSRRPRLRRPCAASPLRRGRSADRGGPSKDQVSARDPYSEPTRISARGRLTEVAQRQVAPYRCLPKGYEPVEGIVASGNGIKELIQAVGDGTGVRWLTRGGVSDRSMGLKVKQPGIRPCFVFGST